MTNVATFDPAQLPARDSKGYVSHPHLELICPTDSDLLPRELFHAAGWDVDLVFLYEDTNAPESVRDAYDDGNGVADWNPSVPAGKGWQLVGLWDTADGAQALFVKPRKMAA